MPLNRAHESDRDKLKRLNAIEAIRRLVFAYGYYLDRWLYDDVVTCFSQDAEFQIGNGVFKGRDEGIRRLFSMIGKNWQALNPPVPGGLSEHHIHQDIIDVDVSAGTASGRFRLLEFVAAHESNERLRLGPPGGPYDPKGSRQWIGGSMYLSRFVLREGIWLISRQHYCPVWNASYTQGPAHSWPAIAIFQDTFPNDSAGPDALVDIPAMWPETSILPFHFAHPVTGPKVVDH